MKKFIMFIIAGSTLAGLATFVALALILILNLVWGFFEYELWIFLGKVMITSFIVMVVGMIVCQIYFNSVDSE